MTLVATVRLRRGRYDASGTDDRLPELIPSPYRLFCALVAVAGRDGDPADHSGLLWLENQEPPIIVVPQVLDAGRNDAFYVTNRLEPKGGSLSHPGRKNNVKHRSWVSFDEGGFQFIWEATPDPEILAALQRLADGVTYLGRVESTVGVRFLAAEPMIPDGARMLHCVPMSEGGREVFVPFRGALEALHDAFESGRSSWQVARPAYYAAEAEPTSSAVESPFQSLLVFALAGQPVDGSNALDLAAALRAAVMSRVKAQVGEDGLPAAVHGHVDSVGHLAYLALPFSCHPHSDGRILGLGVAIPTDIPAEDRRVIERALIAGSGLREIRYGRARNGILAVDPVLRGTQVRTLQASRWIGNMAGSRTWASVTPVMLDKYPHKPTQVEELAAQTVVNSGYPMPTKVEASPVSVLRGAVRYRKGWQRTLGDRPVRPLWHLAIEFAEPQRGPVILGALRYLGGGLCVPTNGALQPDAHVLEEVTS